MNFKVEVGDKEKTTIEFSRDWFTGSFSAYINGERKVLISALSPFTHFTLKKLHRFEFTVGTLENHDIVLEKQSPVLLAGFRGHRYRVFVDGELFHEETGS